MSEYSLLSCMYVCSRRACGVESQFKGDLQLQAPVKMVQAGVRQNCCAPALLRSHACAHEACTHAPLYMYLALALAAVRVRACVVTRQHLQVWKAEYYSKLLVIIFSEEEHARVQLLSEFD